MGLGQMYLATGNTMVEEAIARIKQYEPPEGYILAFSGGKDSVVVRDLTIKAGVKFETHYCRTGIDPPEHVQWMRKAYPGIKEIAPLVTMWEGIAQHGLPLRRRRWCCELMKEHDGKGRVVLQGVRWYESAGRRRRWDVVSPIYRRARADKKGTVIKTSVNPIIDWSDLDVWVYIRSNGIPYSPLYDEGFQRIGCVMCPFSSGAHLKLEMTRWPKIAEAYVRAADRYVQRENERGFHDFATGQEYFDWWINERLGGPSR